MSIAEPVRIRTSHVRGGSFRGQFMPMWGFNVEPGVGFVPTSYNFSCVIALLLEFREIRPEGGIPEFQQRLILENNYRRNTAVAYSYPLRHYDCDLASQSLATIRVLAKQPTSADAKEWLRSFRRAPALDEVPKSIVCAYLVCECIRAGIFAGVDRAADFVERGHAGRQNAGSAMNTVGLGIARHFGLVDETQPAQPTVTARFDEVFKT